MTRQTSRPDSDGLAVSNGQGHFSEALALVIRFTGKSPKELAAGAGRSPAAVSQWLHKGDIPSLDVIFAIEDHLGVRRGLLARYVEPSFRLPVTELTFEELITEGFLKAPLTDAQRKMFMEMLAQVLEINRSKGSELPPALPEP